ncbi:MAG: DUF3574 domain-containing protein [Gammaproteobacteria bacterium]
MNQMRHIMVAVSLAAGLALNSAWALDISAPKTHSGALSERRFCEKRLHGELFSRTELFFGLSRSSGPDVTEKAFQHFIDTEVTPRFPDGLTLLSGKGQFKDSTGTIIQEGSKLLILLYPFNKKSNRAVEKIREEYKKDFQQESVLRVDEQSCVSF